MILIPILIPLLFKLVSNNSSDNTNIIYQCETPVKNDNHNSYANDNGNDCTG